jgi:hypothetical protein
MEYVKVLPKEISKPLAAAIIVTQAADRMLY